VVLDPAALDKVAADLHWCRYLILGPGDGQQDLPTALRLLAPAYRAQPYVVPDQVRAYFDADLLASPGYPAVMADRAVDLLRQALDASPADHPDRAMYLSNFGLALQTRFERTGVLADLDEAIHRLHDAVAASPADHPDRAMYLSNLGLALQTRFERTGVLADLDEAIHRLHDAVAASPADHPARAGRLSNLGAALQTRFERTGVLADLDEAIGVGRDAVAASPPDNPARAMYLSNLGLALQTRFEQTGVLADLGEATDRLQDAVAASPPDNPARAMYLSNLGLALQTRSFARTGRQADLDEAIDVGRDAVAATPADHPARAGRLSNLGLALRTQFEQTGVLADLDEAVTVGRDAVAATPPDRPARAMYLSNLGLALRTRFEQTGALADLDEAVTVGRDAVEATLPDRPARAMYLSNLGAALRTRFERTGVLADLDEAIDRLHDAVAASTADYPARAGRLSNLGAALRTRFGRTSVLADLDKAIDRLHDAVAASTADHPAHAGRLSNLGLALQTRSEQTSVLADLDKAIDRLHDAVAASTADHPAHAMILANLGNALRIRFERTGVLADLDEAVTTGRGAVAVEVASPRVRAVAARGWGRAAAVGGRWPEAVAGFEAGVGLLGQVAPRSLARRDQEQLLEDLGGLASEAAACCVHAGLVDRAVELFEQGRGVLLGQALDTRTDLTALAEQHPDLAERFTALRDDLDRADDCAGRPVALPAGADGAAADRAELARRDVERRREVADRFDRLIAEIRTVPGFDTFLRPLPVRDLAVAAADGPVVVVNVSRFGSHALILTGSGVLDPVPLEDLTPEAVYEHVVEFLAALDDMSAPTAGPSSRASAERRLAETLGWLWDALAGPVLDRLSVGGPPQEGESWSRLWWCVSGLLSFLPVHAAGHHQYRRDPVPQTVIDRVVSSYTPTIRALTYARRTRPPDGGGGGPAGRRGRVVVLAMPHTPGAADLPGAQAEADLLRRRFADRVSTLVGAEATRDAVLAALPAARWAHFACHGASDLTNPSASHLLLTDHRQRPLTVVDVARLRLDAELAFLSACSTARPGGRLADEAIQLASAFQLAGYRQVIGTLWPIGDQDAVDLADDVYTDLTADAYSGTVDAAAALHTVTRQLRDRWWKQRPSVWASHIHSGT
jgi:tetratricopeptide (TPR) repeat protein